jgi:hypothetical protein
MRIQRGDAFHTKMPHRPISCIEKIVKSAPKGGPRCPECRAEFKVKDIRDIIAPVCVCGALAGPGAVVHSLFVLARETGSLLSSTQGFSYALECSEGRSSAPLFFPSTVGHIVRIAACRLDRNRSSWRSTTRHWSARRKSLIRCVCCLRFSSFLHCLLVPYRLAILRRALGQQLLWGRGR